MASELTKAIKVGDVVTVNGVKPRAMDLLFAVSVVNAQGKSVIDHGTDKKH